MRKRELHKLKAGQKFARIDNGILAYMRVDPEGINLAPSEVELCYVVNLGNGLLSWKAPGLIVWTESQWEAAKRFGECGSGMGINWEWFYFPSHQQAAEFVNWCDYNEVEHRGISYPHNRHGKDASPTDVFFGVRVR